MANDKKLDFVFYTNSLPFDEQQDFVAHIPTSIGDTATLFRVLFENLELPGYFGFNWDALSECLRDLSWLTKYRVVVFHHDLPRLPKDDLVTYLDILRECTGSWEPGEDHELVVAFPEECQSSVLGAMNVQE